MTEWSSKVESSKIRRWYCPSFEEYSTPVLKVRRGEQPNEEIRIMYNSLILDNNFMYVRLNRISYNGPAIKGVCVAERVEAGE